LVVTLARRKSAAAQHSSSRRLAAGLAAGSTALVILVALQVRDAQIVMAKLPGPFFDWAVGYDWAPAEGIEFLRRNPLALNVCSDWLNAGPLLFLTPNCKVFADGRAQQLYPVEHYVMFESLVAGNFDAAETQRILDDSHTDAILFARGVARA